jgi:hypothetical protein
MEVQRLGTTLSNGPTGGPVIENELFLMGPWMFNDRDKLFLTGPLQIQLLKINSF